MASPYAGLDTSEWKAKTQELLAQHPLTLGMIRESALTTWELLWQTTIGVGDTAIRLGEIAVPAIVVGYFFEKLFARDLERRFPGQWRGTEIKAEKDLVYLANSYFSVEVKSSGQMGTKIFGNRSYNQKAEKEETEEEGQIVKVEKSGYYVTVNFYRQTLTLLRFGWIDLDDWEPQKSAKGQAATLKPEVYQHKLAEVPGSYRLNAPVRILPGVGDVYDVTCANEGIILLSDLWKYAGQNKIILGFQKRLKEAGAYQD